MCHEKLIYAFKEDKIDLAVMKKLKKKLGMYETYLEKQRAETKFPKIRDLIKLKRSLKQISAVTFPEPAVLLTNFDERIELLDIKVEDGEDITILEVKHCLQLGEIEDLRYANSKMKKYYEQLDRLVIENGICYRKFLDDDGIVNYSQLVRHKHFKES